MYVGLYVKYPIMFISRFAHLYDT